MLDFYKRMMENTEISEEERETYSKMYNSMASKAGVEALKKEYTTKEVEYVEDEGDCESCKI